MYFASGNLTLLWTGLLALICGAICVAMDRIGERLDMLQDQVSRINDLRQSQQRETAIAAAQQVVERLRNEGLLRSGAAVDDESIPEKAE